MGGLAGFLGTYLIGPRVGLFYPDEKLAFVLDDLLLDDDGNDFDQIEKRNEEQQSFEKYKKGSTQT